MAGFFGLAIFVVLLFLFPQRMIPIIVAAVVFIIGLLFYIHYDERMKAARLAAVTATIAYDISACGAETPLSVEVSNKSDSVVTNIRFSVEGYREGHSRAIYATPFRGYETDRIIKIGETWSKCWELPPVRGTAPKDHAEKYPPETIVWKVADISPTFGSD